MTKRHQVDQLDFALTHQYKTADNWACTIFTDETKINKRGSDGCCYCYAQPGEGLSQRTIQPTIKHGGGSTTVWGAMTMQGVGRMCFIDGIMNVEKYVKILDQHLLPTARTYKMDRTRFVFQQDNDPKHTSAKAHNYFHDHNINVLKWPAQSPNLNPIEHLWEHLKRKLNAYLTHPTSIYELHSQIEHEWKKINPEVCKKLILSMPDRLEAVIRAKGGPTKY